MKRRKGNIFIIFSNNSGDTCHVKLLDVTTVARIFLGFAFLYELRLIKKIQLLCAKIRTILDVLLYERHNTVSFYSITAF